MSSLGVGVMNFENTAGRWLLWFLVPNLSLAAWKRRSRLPIADSRLAPAACHPRFRTDAYSHWVKPQLGVLTFAWVKMSTTIYSITASRALRTSSAVECHQQPFSFPSGFSESPTSASAEGTSSKFVNQTTILLSFKPFHVIPVYFSCFWIQLTFLWNCKRFYYNIIVISYGT